MNTEHCKFVKYDQILVILGITGKQLASFEGLRFHVLNSIPLYIYISSYSYHINIMDSRVNYNQNHQDIERFKCTIFHSVDLMDRCCRGMNFFNPSENIPCQCEVPRELYQ